MRRKPVSHVASRPGLGVRLETKPERTGEYLSFKVAALGPGGSFEGETGSNEVAGIQLTGTARFGSAGQTHPVSWRDVFAEMPHPHTCCREPPAALPLTSTAVSSAGPPVAQWIRATDFGSVGRGFESLRAGHNLSVKRPPDDVRGPF